MSDTIQTVANCYCVVISVNVNFATKVMLEVSLQFAHFNEKCYKCLLGRHERINVTDCEHPKKKDTLYSTTILCTNILHIYTPQLIYNVHDVGTSFAVKYDELNCQPVFAVIY